MVKACRRKCQRSDDQPDNAVNDVGDDDLS